MGQIIKQKYGKKQLALVSKKYLAIIAHLKLRGKGIGQQKQLLTIEDN